MIRERRASGVEKQDLLGMLLVAKDEDDGSGMDEKQIRDELMTIFLAGHETTANAMAWTFYLLAQHPHVWTRMTDEIDRVLGRGGRLPTLADLPQLPYTLQVFKESMRLYPPAYVVGRQAARDVVIGGHRFRKGAVAMINIIGIHRSPHYFADPDTFDPSRFAAEKEKSLPRHAYMPFGGGPRICIGNHFALMEGHLLVATHARKVRLELAPGVRVSPEPLVTLRPRGGMPMRVRMR
jgi:cytochrome P450